MATLIYPRHSRTHRNQIASELSNRFEEDWQAHQVDYGLIGRSILLVVAIATFAGFS